MNERNLCVSVVSSGQKFVIQCSVQMMFRRFASAGCLPVCSERVGGASSGCLAVGAATAVLVLKRRLSVSNALWSSGRSFDPYSTKLLAVLGHVRMDGTRTRDEDVERKDKYSGLDQDDNWNIISGS